MGSISHSMSPRHAGPSDRPFFRSQSKQIAHTFALNSVSVQQLPQTIRWHDAQGPTASLPQKAHCGGESSPMVWSCPVTWTHPSACLFACSNRRSAGAFEKFSLA